MNRVVLKGVVFGLGSKLFRGGAGGMWIIGDYYRPIEADARRLDYSACGLGFS